MTASVAIIHQKALLNEDDITHDIIRGLTSEKVDVVTYSVEHAHACLDELDQFDGMVFGFMSKQVNDSAHLDAFIDATTARYQNGIWRDKIATAFTSSLRLCADSMPLMLQLSLFCARHNMIWIDNDEDVRTSADKGDAEYNPARSISAPGYEYGQRLGRVTKQWLDT